MIRIAVVLATTIAGCLQPASAQTASGDITIVHQAPELQPAHGAIVIGYRRSDDESAGNSGTLEFARYDIDNRRLSVWDRQDWEGYEGETQTNPNILLFTSRDRHAEREYLILPAEQGHYALVGATVSRSDGPHSFCLSAPVFRVAAGEIVYFGDVTPYSGVRLANGQRATSMAYSLNVDDARAAVVEQMGSAEAFRTADIRNGATFACPIQLINAYEVPGAPRLEEERLREESPPMLDEELPAENLTLGS
ncbi:MAG: hypothetical protein AAGE05_10100 [Pseudomonadota bacterium]